jgi:hypothetical protein
VILHRVLGGSTGLACIGIGSYRSSQEGDYAPYPRERLDPVDERNADVGAPG